MPFPWLIRLIFPGHCFFRTHSLPDNFYIERCFKNCLLLRNKTVNRLKYVFWSRKQKKSNTYFCILLQICLLDSIFFSLEKLYLYLINYKDQLHNYIYAQNSVVFLAFHSLIVIWRWLLLKSQYLGSGTLFCLSPTDMNKNDHLSSVFIYLSNLLATHLPAE